MRDESGFLRVFKKMDKAYVSFSNVLACVSGGCLIVVMLLAFFDVVSAKVFNNGIPGQYEVIQVLSIPMLYLTLSYTHLTRDQIKITLVLDRLPKVLHEIIIYFGYCLGVFMSLFMAWHSFRYVIKLEDMSKVTSGVAAIQEWPICLILVLGCVFLAIAYVFTIIRRIINYNVTVAFDPNEDEETGAPGDGVTAGEEEQSHD